MERNFHVQNFYTFHKCFKLIPQKTIHVASYNDNLKCAGANYIKVMLMENNKLQYLDISRNIIGDDGVRLITEGLQCNNTLTKLNEQDCGISVTGK